MASRLSESALQDVYDRGVQGLPWTMQTGLATPNGIDLKTILEHPQSREIVSATSALELYRAIKTQGIEDHIELLPLLTSDQATRIVDFDCWQGGQLVPSRAFSWLKLFREISHEEFFGRFKELEEEYQLALLVQKIAIIDKEEWEKLGDTEQDLYAPLPCNELFYRITTEDQETHEFVDTLVQCGLMVDVEYTYSLLTHASHMPPHEDEERIAQFRNARLEEEGFVPVDIALPIFTPLATAAIAQLKSQAELALQAVRSLDDLGSLARKSTDGQPFIDQVFVEASTRWPAQDLDNFVGALVHLTNTVAAASQLGPEELNQIDRVGVLVRAALSFALDDLTSGDVRHAAVLLGKTHPTLLFQYALAEFQATRLRFASRLESSGLQGLENFQSLVSQGKLGRAMTLVDQHLLPLLGLETAETFKGLLNRFVLSQDKSEDAARIAFQPLHSRKQLTELHREINGDLETLLAMRDNLTTLTDTQRATAWGNPDLTSRTETTSSTL